MTTRDAEVDRLFWEGEAARQAGRTEDALAAHRRAGDILRDRLARDPRDAAAHEKLAALLYVMGASLVGTGQPEAAAAALDDSERHYEQSGARKDLLIADVRARRAGAHARAGRPVSALSDVDRAIEGYVRQGVQSEGPPRSLDFARVLSQAAVVHRAHGDPDQALACAAQAMARFKEGEAAVNAAQAMARFKEGEAAVNADPAWHLGYAVYMAADTASVLEAARGNWRNALALDDFVLSVTGQGWGGLARALARKGVHLRDAGRAAEAEPYLSRAEALDSIAVAEEERIAAEPLPRSLDEVLRTAGAATGQAGVAVLRRMLTTEESCSVSGRIRDHASAPLHARRLADIAAAVAPGSDPDAAWRLALESHLLYDALFRRGADGAATWLDAHGGTWTTALVTLGRVAEQYGTASVREDVRAAVERLHMFRAGR